ncbi:flagellar hook assembly protein FlgD [Halobacillus rhizosphaerae]|uniref:flagellar hook assembly protein FlgD n=1 Tax=Halobacillus rhizosphaerae TaxID=3064889 RepID=UPI00398AE27F
MTKIDPTFYLKNQQPKTASNGTLGKDDFLKILMAQLQNQNPLDPMKDKEFVSQMTQFSSLEQMTNMSESFQNYMNSQNRTPVVQYSSLIGKQVTYPVKDEETGMVDHQAEGTVKAVSQSNGQTNLELEDGSSVAVEEITKVSNEED